jgi:tRNA(fMet)-specific endonuclease VapC
MLDTNHVVYAIRAEGAVRRRVESAFALGLCVSAVSIAELEYGSLRSPDPERHRARWRRFLDPFDVLPFDCAAALEHAAIRAVLRQAPIGERDLLIAASARAHRLTVVTHNLDEFRRVPGLLVEDWL